MKTYIVELPDGITPTDCTVCGDRYPCGLKHCALDKAKEAVGPLSGKQIHPDAMEYHTGINCKVYAVEDK